MDVQARLRDASLHAARGTERERSHVHAVVSHVTGDSRPLVAHLAAYPLDALLLSTAVPTIAFAGVTEVPEEAWSIVERAIPAYGDDWWFTGLLAFVRQEQGRFDEAMSTLLPVPGRRARRRPLRARPGARALRDRRPRMPGWPGWTRWVTGDGASIDSLSHFAWHAALHELSLGDLDAVRRRYDAQLRPEHGLGCRALVDTGSLLFRWALTPDATDVPGLEQVAALAGRDVLERPSTPFLAMHSAVTLLALDDRPALDRLAGGPPRTTTRPSVRSSLPWPAPSAGWPPDGTPRPRTPSPRWLAPAAGSAAPTPSARSSRRPGSQPWCAPTGWTRHASCWTRGSTGGTHPETRRWLRQADRVA